MTSLPVITAGWSKIMLFLESSGSGDLTVQVDVVGDGEWIDYLTLRNVTRKVVTIKGPFAMMRLRFSPNNGVTTVTAKITLDP